MNIWIIKRMENNFCNRYSNETTENCVVVGDNSQNPEDSCVSCNMVGQWQKRVTERTEIASYKTACHDTEFSFWLIHGSRSSSAVVMYVAQFTHSSVWTQWHTARSSISSCGLCLYRYSFNRFYCGNCVVLTCLQVRHALLSLGSII